MHKRTKALAISKAVKAAVYARDGGCCVLCGSPYGIPNPDWDESKLAYDKWSDLK